MKRSQIKAIKAKQKNQEHRYVGTDNLIKRSKLPSGVTKYQLQTLQNELICKRINPKEYNQILQNISRRNNQ